MATGPVQVRPWQAADSLAELTALLHRAYAPLAAAGLNFTAASQTEAMTLQRLQGAHTWVAVHGAKLVGSITAAGPFDPNAQAWAHALPWFYRQDLAHFHQFAVDPPQQGQGVGAALLRRRESWRPDASGERSEYSHDARKEGQTQRWRATGRERCALDGLTALFQP